MEQVYNRIKSDRNLYRTLCIATTLLYPALLVLVVENTHLQSIHKLAHFVTGSAGVFLYDIFFVGAIFAGLALLLRQVWAAMFVQGMALYALSLVEYFKYDANGSHFSIADLVMAGKVSDIARFASIEVNSAMVVNLAVLIIYVLWAAFLRIKVRLKPLGAISLGASALAVLTVALSVPSIYSAMYKTFGVDYRQGYGPYSTDETFQCNMQIAFLSQNISSEITRKFDKPKNYSRQSINALLPAYGEELAAPENTPDIIIIMSEAYTDFRRFENLDVPDGTYQNFDTLAREGNKGNAMVPTFGGYTAKTEYELLFGLPVKGIQDESIPHQLFTDGKPRPTFAAYLHTLGYATSFIHPFSASFYNRDKAYRGYGFDHVLFEDDLTATQSRLGEYIDDKTLVEQIKTQLEQSSKPGLVFAVSMQNHGPYTDEPEHTLKDKRLTNTENEELGRYLYGIAQTDSALGALKSYLESRDRPAVLLFVGDHYPYLGRQGKLYKKLGKSADPYSLYQQPYLLWSNRANSREIPQQRVSAFYLPHIVADYAGLPKDRFMEDMYGMMQTTPLFTFDKGENSKDKRALMQLTYDRTRGKAYSM